jgi:transcriptional regulator with XRE-family HTH domain
MVNFLQACGVRDDRMVPWVRAWERIAVSELGSVQPRTMYIAQAGQARVGAKTGQKSERPRRETAGDPNDKNVSAEPPLRLTASVVNPETERLREQINQLNADNNRLRLQLTAIDRQWAEQESHITTAVNVRVAHSPIACRRELGILLRILREDKGLTIKQVAEHLMCSTNKVRRMETSFRAGTLRDVRDLCDLYGVTNETERDRIMKLAEEGKQRGWWQSYGLAYATYVGLEAEASTISCFHSSVVPGLLQTADYARAGHEGAMPRLSPNRIEMQIEAKLIRQHILTQNSPARLAAILDESALHRMVGGRQVMAAQLAKILMMSARPNVVVQVLPYKLGAHPALESNFTILQLPNQTPDLVFVEGLIGSIYLERAEDLERYREVFNRLQSIALNPKDTYDLIESLGRSYRDYSEA